MTIILVSLVYVLSNPHEILLYEHQLKPPKNEQVGGAEDLIEQYRGGVGESPEENDSEEHNTWSSLVNVLYVVAMYG